MALWQLDGSVACEKDKMPGELSVVDPIRNPNRGLFFQVLFKGLFICFCPKMVGSRDGFAPVYFFVSEVLCNALFVSPHETEPPMPQEERAPPLFHTVDP